MLGVQCTGHIQLPTLVSAWIACPQLGGNYNDVFYHLSIFNATPTNAHTCTHTHTHAHTHIQTHTHTYMLLWQVVGVSASRT